MPATVLIIEDNIDNLDLVRFLLAEENYRILTARDGKEGLALARKELPEIILLDLALPEMDGWRLARAVKDDPQTAGIKVVAITAHALPYDRERAMEAGCDGYITKPLDINGFPAQIAAYLKPPQAS